MRKRVLSALEPILALPAREAVDEPGVWPWQDLYADALVDLGRLEEAERFLRRTSNARASAGAGR